jgi:predicted DNA-binding transcriptional regulator AlpA
MATATSKCVTLKELVGMFGVTKKTLLGWVRQGRFPKPLAVSPNKFIWPRAVIEAVLAGRQGGEGTKNVNP